MILKNKKVIVIGDKGGISGPAIKQCVETAGAEVIYCSTECFACSTSGGIGPDVQQKILDLTKEYDPKDIVVVLGGAEAEVCGLSAETVSKGDPTEIGPLTGVSLKLPAYHVLEQEIKTQFDEEVYNDQCAVMELVLPIYDISNEMKDIRENYCMC